MRSILVCTDFSPASIHAATYAASLALSLKANILLLHVRPSVESYNQAPVAEVEAAAAESANFQMEQLVAEMRRSAGQNLQVDQQVEVGDFFSFLYAICARLDPQLVVFGSQGTTAAERFLLGSNSIHAMKNLDWPLITVPPTATWRPVHRIGLASDFEQSPQSLPADKIREFVEATQASLHIVHVGKSKEVSTQTVSETTKMQNLLQDLEPRFYFIAGDSVEDGIHHFCDAHQIDILMAFPREHGFLGDLFHKSVSRRLLLTSQIPVMVLRPAK